MGKDNFKLSPLIFVDSNVFIALLRKDDSLHEKARKKALDLEKTGAFFITNNYIIAEALTVLLLRTKSLKASLILGKMVYEKKNPWFKVYEIDFKLQKEAWEIFRSQKASHQLSFADCTLPVLAKHLGIKEIFSFDKKFKIFEKMGFKILN